MSGESTEAIRAYATTSYLNLATASVLPKRVRPDWMAPDDSLRVVSYDTFEDIYWNVPLTFKLDQRGSNTEPIYIPSGRNIVETTTRWTARGFNYSAGAAGTPADQAALKAAFDALFKREEFFSKFLTQKRFGMIRGDAFWHILGNDKAAPGRKISLLELDPRRVVRIPNAGDWDRTDGWFIVDLVTINKKDYIRRQMYLKVPTAGGLPQIRSALGYYDPKKSWANPDDTALAIDPGTYEAPYDIILPDQITALPVYHVKSFRLDNWPFGVSEMRGYERLMGAINQTISDQELALAIDGIGVYHTTSGPPVDENGNEVDWNVGPGTVVEHAPGTDFNRASGVTSLPGIQHADWLRARLQEGAALPNIAIGTVDVTVATSGIARILEMGPLLAKVDEKNDLIVDKFSQMFYDLARMWMPALEAQSFGDVVPEAVVGQTLPPDDAADLTAITSALATVPPLISTQYARTKLRGLALFADLPVDDGNTVQSEQDALNSAADQLNNALGSLDTGGAGATGEVPGGFASGQ